MKKLVCALLVFAALLAGVAALADKQVGEEVEVTDCREYITLRREPSTSAPALARMPLGARATVIRDDGDDFIFIRYGRQAGYALRRYLTTVNSFDGRPVQPSRKERYNINLFLSNFTEQNFAWGEWHLDAKDLQRGTLVDFAVEHIWFNQPKRLEWGQWGEDNVRLSDRYIPAVVRKYFGVSPRSLDGTRYDHRDGYYYWQETGGHLNGGFACMVWLYDMGGGVYSVWFYALGDGENWSNDVCRDTLQKSETRYEICRFCHALIDVGPKGSLADRSGWRLIRYTLDPMW